ncbi:Peptidoglycan/LPS O-acetylase OafA/YrhL [Commensalibacter communis]|uniref:acyltransferase family protein n=1 Tax=Commensalibacter communis TaxID=2972786 RepID=UPI0022FF83C2|nr:acyltransferase [Commensalibacter communis]CAI3925630.1 Peptidoglycan/LPS O-acetylase OafA/YrhL [Commensalibacter communis]
MTYDAVGPLCIILLIMVVFLSLPIPLFRNIQVVQQRQDNRLYTIDGLRGYLAYFIVFLHATVWYNLISVHQFKGSEHTNVELLGTTGLCIFFMVSSFLFWTRWLNHQGKIQVIPFYIKRFFRTAPIYYLCILCLFIAVMSKTHWHLDVSIWSFIKQILSWLSFGLFSFPPINGYGLTSLLVMGVVWTIPYEWMLYLALPIIGVFSKNIWLSFWFAITLCVFTVLAQFYWKIHFIADNDMMPFASYAIGMLIATLKQMKWQPPLNDICGSFIMTGCIILLLIFCHKYPEPLMLFFGGVFFYCVVSGGSLFGLFKLPASQRMGRVSYSIYLCQGLILYFFSDTLIFVKQFMLRSIWHYWVAFLGECIILLIIACCLYIIVEKPCMDLGREIADKYIKNKRNKCVTTK